MQCVWMCGEREEGKQEGGISCYYLPPPPPPKTRGGVRGNIYSSFLGERKFLVIIKVIDTIIIMVFNLVIHWHVRPLNSFIG
jgi:hypothetical protein